MRSYPVHTLISFADIFVLVQAQAPISRPKMVNENIFCLFYSPDPDHERPPGYDDMFM